MIEKSLKNGISILSACMNRNYNIIKNLKNWLKFDEVSEIIIVDWNSKDELYNDILNNNLFDERIKIIRVLEQPRWILTYAFNVGIQFVNYNKLLKIDADIYLSENFFEKNILNEDTFISGNWKTARNENELHLNGQLFVSTNDFLNVNGYNEFITTYGFDDCDLYKRLELINLDKKDFHLNTIFHLENTNNERISNQKICDVDYEIIKNNLISQSFNWDSSNKIIELKNIQFKNPNYIIIKNVSSKYEVNDEFLIENKQKIEFGFLMKKIKNQIPEKLLKKILDVPIKSQDYIKERISTNSLNQDKYFKNNNLNKSSYNIAFLVPVVTKSNNDIDNLLFYNNTLETINNLYRETKKYIKNLNFTIYLGYDHNDPVFDNKNNQVKVIKHTKKNVNINLNIKFYKVNEEKSSNPVNAWNRLYELAYNQNNDYFYQIGDDIINTKNDSLINYISFLESKNNIGICYPFDFTYPLVYTQTFVSRKHFEIFGFYFDPLFKNWFCDNWISNIYPQEYIYEYSFCFNKLTKPRYEIKNINKSLLDISVKKGADSVSYFLKKGKTKNNLTKIEKNYLKTIDFSVVCVTNKENKLENIFNNFINQNHKSKELILIFNFKKNIDSKLNPFLEKYCKDYQIKYYYHSDLTLGECLNKGVIYSSGAFFAKFDDDDIYLENYLSEAMAEIKSKKIKIIGKGLCTIFIPENKKYLMRYESKENDFCNKIYGGTIICQKKILLKYKFENINLGEDSNWIKNIIKNGFNIYSSSYNNYIYVRSINSKNHTWKIEMNDFIKTCFELPKHVKKELNKISYTIEKNNELF